MSEVQRKNRERLKYFKNITFLLGLNFDGPSRYDRYLNTFAKTIAVISWGCVYGNSQFIVKYIRTIPLTAMEAFMTGLQVCLSVIKFMYVIRIREHFTSLVLTAERNEILNSLCFYKNVKKKRCERILEETLNSARFQIWFLGFAYVGIIGYYFCDAITRNVIEYYIMKNENYTRLFPLPAFFPGLDKTSFPYHEIEFCVVGIGDYVAGIAQLCFDGYFIVLVQHAVGLFRVLHVVIDQIEEVPKHKKLSYLKMCIDFYMQSFVFYSKVNTIYSKVGILQLISSLGVVGVAIFEASIGLQNDFLRLVRSIIYIFAVVFQIGLYCFNGQLLTNESDKLCFSWYSVKWYEEPKDFRKLIYMSMIRTTKNVYMEATGFTSLVRSTFLTIMRTSASYFLLLRNVSGNS